MRAPSYIYICIHRYRCPIRPLRSTGAGHETSIKNATWKLTLVRADRSITSTSRMGRLFAFMGIHFWVGMTATRALEHHVFVYSVYPKQIRDQEPPIMFMNFSATGKTLLSTSPRRIPQCPPHNFL